MSLPDPSSITDTAVAVSLAAIALLIAISALISSRSRTRALVERLDHIELQMSTIRDNESVLRKVHIGQDKLPLLTEQHLGVVFAQSGNSFDARAIAEELADALRSNSLAAFDIANLILDSDKLDELEERQRLSREVKSHALKLDPSFWDRHGHVIRHSRFPDVLKGLLEKFFKQVRVLKENATQLKTKPMRSEIEAVLDRATKLIETGIQIIDEFQKLPGSTVGRIGAER